MGNVVEAHINTRKNVIAVDSNAIPAVRALLAKTSTCGVPVGAFFLRPYKTNAGVGDMDASMSDGKLLWLCYSGVKAAEARHFGSTKQFSYYSNATECRLVSRVGWCAAQFSLTLRARFNVTTVTKWVLWLGLV